MSDLKARLRTDLSMAMKDRDELTTATLRMVLAAVQTEEVAGERSRELTEDEVLRVLAREAKKRRQAAEIYDEKGRAELADRERAETSVIDRYLPAQLSDVELAEMVRVAVEQTGATELRHMGQVIKAVAQAAGGRAENGRIADEVRRALTRP